jgi:hypothetical protein
MSKLNNIAIIFSVLIFSFSFNACCSKKKIKTDTTTTNTPPSPRDFEAEGFLEATVIIYEVDGCTWMLRLMNQKLLQPYTPLPTNFQKNDLQVWIKFTAEKDAMTTCMAGDVVNVVAIELKK